MFYYWMNKVLHCSSATAASRKQFHLPSDFNRFGLKVDKNYASAET
jgi:hypothetical protein